jgi:hypothetical protein
MAHRIQVRVRPRSFKHWFKNRLPPSPSLQAGFHFGCYGKKQLFRKRRLVKIRTEVQCKIPALAGGLLKEKAGPETRRDASGHTKDCKILLNLYFAGWGRLAGGMMPFMRRYSTIWP